MAFREDRQSPQDDPDALGLALWVVGLLAAATIATAVAAVWS